jgi:hypothetical protein
MRQLIAPLRARVARSRRAAADGKKTKRAGDFRAVSKPSRRLRIGAVLASRKSARAEHHAASEQPACGRDEVERDETRTARGTEERARVGKNVDEKIGYADRGKPIDSPRGAERREERRLADR